ncbi:MAG: Carboxypeptidase regulatory-like domain [Pyrinomonadaceae bacterium]|nr:Carboxypeptidase regulatory-like domain [Pyrinomonadaceae bacterium]
MKKDARLAFGLAIGLAVVPGTTSVAARTYHPLTGQLMISAGFVQGRNAIYGRVYGPSRQPVGDMYVELLDDMGSTITRQKADASGRFTFTGLGNGRFMIKVLPYNTPYLEQLQDVTLSAVSAAAGSGADQQQVDVYLRENPRANVSPFGGAPGVLFAQDVPAAARKLYSEGIGYLRDKKEKEGFESLKKSLEIFPTYYDALDRLGAEYAMRGVDASGKLNPAYLQAGGSLLMKAVEVNPRGYSSVFGLAWTQFQLGMIDQAIENFRTATTIYGKGADAQLWLGKALKRAAKLELAEAAFKRANQFSEGKGAEVHKQLAGLYSEQKRYKEAADELELFLKVQPKNKETEAEFVKIRELIKQLRDKAATTPAPAAPATN